MKVGGGGGLRLSPPRGKKASRGPSASKAFVPETPTLQPSYR